MRQPTVGAARREKVPAKNAQMVCAQRMRCGRVALQGERKSCHGGLLTQLMSEEPWSSTVPSFDVHQAATRFFCDA